MVVNRGMEGVLLVALVTVMVGQLAGAGPLSKDRIITPDQLIELLQQQDSRARLRNGPERDRCSASSSISAAVNSTRCSLVTGTVLYQGQCAALLQQGPCQTQHIIVIDRTTGQAKCERAACPSNQVAVQGGCQRLGPQSSAQHCPATQQLIANEFGEAECECPASRIYHPPTGQCHTPYRRGPCQPGTVLQVVETTAGSGHGACLPALCPDDTQVPMTPQCRVATANTPPSDYQCYTMSTTGPCKEGFLAVDLYTSDVVCLLSEPYALFARLPSRPCSHGSRRDDSGRCRPEEARPDGEARDEGGAAVPTAKPSLYSDGSVCPEGYFFLGGTCIHLIQGT